MRNPLRVNYMNSGGGCIGWFIILILLIFCFPIGIIAVFIYSKYDEMGEKKQRTFWNWIYILAIGFIAVMSPVLAFISLFFDFEDDVHIGVFWVITIIEIGICIYIMYSKIQKNRQN